MQYQVGDIVEGTITGIQPYGAFVALDNHTSGLIHISEISDGFVKDVGMYVQLHDRIQVKIIDFDPKLRQARLSIKAIRKNNARKERKQRSYGSLPPMDLGFSSIEKKMPEWINNALKEIKEN
ncbi:MAG: S1 RNA-binding domain-containing protein [Erysipelotrichaceae bacterium]|nr:S1 RNA-binding domain-containing protein [Erysipelotrichaceae bacterium]